MRRWWAGMATCAAATLALTGCAGGPAGVDGDLTNNWATIGAPEAFVPLSGVCHLRLHEAAVNTYRPVDCVAPHRAETVHVGTLTGQDAGEQAPPPVGSPTFGSARAECEKKANELLGADWRTGRLALTVLVPQAEAWSGGARWYRCDLSEIESLDNDKPVPRTGSLKGALAGPASPLAHTCFNPKMIRDDINFMAPVPCDQPHHAEFAGIYLAPDTTLQEFSKDATSAHKACMGVIASFAKVPNNVDIGLRVGSIYYHPDEDGWLAGNRGVQCFLWVNDRDLTRSVKGAGPAALPAT
jgi:hypothetical protein